MWALAFYLIENIDEIHLEANFIESVLQAALQQLLEVDTTFYIHNAVLKVIFVVKTKRITNFAV